MEVIPTLSARLTSTVVAVVLLVAIPGEPGFGQPRQSGNIDELRERDDLLRPRAGVNAPDIGKFKTLTPEERRERTLRRKLRRVDELIDKGRYKEGAILLESLRMARNAREFAHVQYTLAFAYSQSQQPEKAIRHYERVLNAPGVPESVEVSARRRLAQLYYGQGEAQLWDEDAQAWFRKAQSSMRTWMGAAPNKAPEDYLFLSRIQLELNDLPGAIENLETAIRLVDEQGAPVVEEWTALLARMKSASGVP